MELLNCFLIYYLHKSKFLSYYTVRYHRCCAPRYRLDVVGLLPLDAASYHTRPWQYSIHSFFMYGTLFWASSKVMCGPHASLRSSVASHPTLPTPSHRLLSIDNTCTTLAEDVSSRYESCAR